MMNRRQLLSAGLLAGLAVRGHAAGTDADMLIKGLAGLEAACGARLGVHVIDTSTAQEYGYRSDKRFLMLSSFKTLAGALVLHRVDSGQESLDRRIPYAAKDLVAWSPVTEKHADGKGMTLGELCEATITTSDNTAANLILSSFGGPSALTSYLRKLGDTITRLDRSEPDLNTGTAEQLLDTTSPRAMAMTVQKPVLGDALSPQSRDKLQRWLLDNTTGARRLKAGIPTGWRIGDKTGTSATDANDVAVIWPVHGSPLVVAAYLAESSGTNEELEETLAAVARLTTGSS